jgi:hypothetical protein
MSWENFAQEGASRIGGAFLGAGAGIGGLGLGTARDAGKGAGAGPADGMDREGAAPGVSSGSPSASGSSPNKESASECSSASIWRASMKSCEL